MKINPENTSRLFTAIAKRQEIPVMKQAFESLTKPENKNWLMSDLKCYSEAIDYVNAMFTNPYCYPAIYKGVARTKHFVEKRGLTTLPNPCREPGLSARALVQTIAEGNMEISRPGLKRAYKVPEEILAEGHGDIRNVARWYLLDGIARWIVNSAQLSKSYGEKETVTDAVVNAICESVLMHAKAGLQDHARLAKWLLHWGSYDTKYGLSHRIVHVANNLTSDIPRFKALPFFTN